MAKKKSLGDVAVINTQVAPTTECVTESTVAGPQGSNGRPVGPDKGDKVVGESTEGPKR